MMLLVRVVPPVVWVPLVTAWWMAPCGCFGGEGVVVDGSGRVSSPPSGRRLVVCWFTSCGGFGFLWWQRLPVATLMVA